MDKEKLYIIVTGNDNIKVQALNLHYFKPSKLFKALRAHLEIIGFDTRNQDTFCVEEDHYGVPSLGKPKEEGRHSSLGLEDTIRYLDVEYPKVTIVSIVFLGKGNWVFKLHTLEKETIWVYPKAFTKPYDDLEEGETYGE